MNLNRILGHWDDFRIAKGAGSFAVNPDWIGGHKILFIVLHITKDIIYVIIISRDWQTFLIFLN